MVTSDVKAYIDYFRQLAVQHINLQHNPASEDGDAAPGACHFSRWTADEVVTGLRSRVNFPALLLELYELTTKSTIEYDVKNNYSGAFSVVQSALKENYASEVEAFALTEKIVSDLLNKIWADHYAPGVERCETPFMYFNFDNINITPFGPVLENEFGYRVEFNFMMMCERTFAHPPAPGIFIATQQGNNILMET